MLKDLIARLTSVKTTVMGVVTALLTVLVAVGVLQQDDASEGAVALDQLYQGVLAVLGGIASIALIFSKDSNVVEKETILSELEEGVED